MFPNCKLKENDVKKYLETVTAKEVEASLANHQPAFSDFINMLSPAAANMLPAMSTRAAQIKKRHFGPTIRLYSPLYISNYCINDCEYCGFRASHKAPRKRLEFDELIKEAEIIRNFGITSLLLVSGEDIKNVSIDYLEKAGQRLKEMFSYVSIEIYPLPLEGYQRLFKAGIHGVTLYQETYNKELYRQLHNSGPKTDFDKRLEHIANAGKAGFYNLGLGALLGLYDWRLESVSMAAHALWLKKHFWKSRIQFSFPRITPIEGGFTVPCEVNEKELEQMILAFRIFFEEADLYISTRESAEFRDRLALSAASHLSAASRVVPGGYNETNNDDLGQFTLNDNRSVEQITADLKSTGLEVVFKDWDLCFG